MLELPDSFKRNVTSLPGGAAWLESLPTLIAACEERFSIRVLQPFDLSYNYVTTAVRAGSEEIVLKISIPNKESKTELRALQLYAEIDAPKLLEFDSEKG